MDVSFISIDPGETNGLAFYDATGKLLWLDQIPMAQMVQVLWPYILNHKPTVICESYKVYPQKAMDHIYSDLKTVRVIGRIEAMCELQGCKLVMQPATVKSSGYRFMGKKRTTPLPHQQDAHAHGIYYLVSSGVIDASSLLR